MVVGSIMKGFVVVGRGRCRVLRLMSGVGVSLMIVGLMWVGLRYRGARRCGI